MMSQIFDWNIFKERFLDDTKGHLIELFLVIGFLGTHFLIKTPKNTKLGFSYWWYLLNAFMIHWYLDGLVGFWGQVKGLYYMYYIMDPRYYRWDIMVFVVCLLEFFVMGPLCFIVAILYKSEKHLLREFLAVVVSVLHIFGTLVYLFGAYVDGFKDNCGLESCFSFSIQNIFFFWGCCVFANPWWLYVPIKEMLKSYRVIEKMIKIKQK